MGGGGTWLVISDIRINILSRPKESCLKAVCFSPFPLKGILFLSSGGVAYKGAGR